MSITHESAAEHAQWLEKISLLREHIVKLCQWIEHFQQHLGPDEIAPDGPAMGAVHDARAAVEMLSEVPIASQAVTAGISSVGMPPLETTAGASLLYLQLRYTGVNYEVHVPDQPESLGVGTTPDEAIGNAVRNAYLSDDEVTIMDISSDDGVTVTSVPGKAAGPPPLPLEDSEIPEDALDPTWSEARRVHDWRNYVSDHVRHLWHTFTPLQRIALAAQAKNEADSEEWD